MNLAEIKEAIKNRNRVFWKSEIYEILKDINGQYLIKCLPNKSCIGLTWTDETTLNGEEDEFYIEDLFINFETQAEDLKIICDKWQEIQASEGLDYGQCSDFKEEVEKIGYTFEYGLDAEPMNLHKIETPKN
jgi:hypothetical protein